MKVLIAGGAGYIGSTVASACLDAGIVPVILDSLVTGRREFTAGRAVYEGDICDGPLVDRLFAEHPDIDAVIHCAALIVVPDSVADPVGYYRANVTKSLEFAGPSAAQRLRAADLQLLGRHLQSRRGPDRRRRLGHRPAEPLRADQGGMRGDVRRHRRRRAAARAVPAVLQPDRRGPQDADRAAAAAANARPGQDDPGAGRRRAVRDHRNRLADQGRAGIRDYIHVWDLATAHVAALTRFDTLPGPVTAINLGTGTGTTVRELLGMFNRVSDRPIPRAGGRAAAR